jgi:hypothetical protein
MQHMSKRVGVIVAVAGLASSALAGTTPATLVIAEGDVLGPSTVASLNSPFTNGLGQVGFVVALVDGQRAVWVDSGPVFFSNDALPDVLSGGESTMGIGDNGEFIYSPSFNGGDAVWGEGGLILVDGTPAPDFLPGFDTTFHSRPRMINDGSSYWVSGTNDGAGGTSTQNRIVYFRDGATGVITGILRAGDVVDGVLVAGAGGIDFDTAISDDGARRLFIFNDAFATTSDDTVVAVDGQIVAREASPSGDGDNWDNFDNTSINSAGDYVFSGDTDGVTTTDEFIAYNGVIAVREGDSVGGLTLGSACNALAINELGQAVFVFSTAEETETLFYAADASDLASAVKIASVGDALDFTGDGIADAVIDDFNASNTIGPGLDLAEDGRVFVEIDMIPTGGAPIEAIVALGLPGPGPCNAADNAAPFGVLDLADVQGFIAGFLAQTAAADLAAPFGVWDLADINAFIAAFNAGCP